SRSFMARLIHEDRERHALVVEARWRAEADEMLLEAVEMIGGFGRPDATRLRLVLGERAAALDRATLATLKRLRVALESGGHEPSHSALREWREELREVAEEAPERLVELFIASLQALRVKPPPANPAAVLPDVGEAATQTVP